MNGSAQAAVAATKALAGINAAKEEKKKMKELKENEPEHANKKKKEDNGTGTPMQGGVLQRDYGYLKQRFGPVKDDFTKLEEKSSTGCFVYKCVLSVQGNVFEAQGRTKKGARNACVDLAFAAFDLNPPLIVNERKHKNPKKIKLLDILSKIKIRYPGDPDATPLSTLLSTKKLLEMLRHQYPHWDKTGHVQFIPEARGFDRFFLNQEHYREVTQKTHGSHFAGKELEFQVQERFSSLKDSAILQDSSLIVMPNLGQKKKIRHDDIYIELKGLLNNEIDDVVIDRNRGLFLCEVKHMEYSKLKKRGDPNYNLDKELKSQERRYKIFSELRAFCGADLHTVPIHTVIFCRTKKPASRIVLDLEEATVKRNGKEYKIIVDLNPDEDFSVVWRKILDLLSTVGNTPSDSENIALLTSLLFAIQHVDKLSHLHQHFIRQGSRKKNNASIIWSREQLDIIDHVTKCFQHQLDDTGTGKLKLCVTGPMGSGKTLLLEQFAEQFSKMFPDSKILLLIADTRFTLLLERLRATYQQFSDNITVASFGEYLHYTSSRTTGTFLAPCADYKLVLVDEFYMHPDWTLDVSHVADSNIVLVTSYSEVAARVGDFTCYNLTGSLRSTREIVRYVKEQQDSERMSVKAVPVSLAHNTSYRDVTTTDVTTGEECIVQCITLIQELLYRDSNVSILVISIAPRWLLYQLNQGLIAKDIPHNFKLHSTESTGSGHDSDNITLCDVDEATGYESCAVVFITDKDRLPAGYVAGLAARSATRATTVAHVIEINSGYCDEMPLILPTSANNITKTPCYVNVGNRTCKGLVQYLSSIVNSDMMNLAISHNKTVLVAYSRARGVITMIEDIQHSLPDELKHTVTFNCYDYTSFDSLNLSKDYILIVQCYSSVCHNIAMWTTLPVRRICLAADGRMNMWGSMLLSIVVVIVTAVVYYQRKLFAKIICEKIKLHLNICC